jgi:peroxiredoxin
MSQLATGTLAPDFELPDTKGRSHRLSDALSEGPVVLAFYKSACPTSQFTFPYIQKVFAQVGSQASQGPRTLWGISEDDAEETRAFAKQYGITFDLLVEDHPYKVSAAYGLEFVPAIFIIQPDGIISLSDFGFSKPALNEIAGFDIFPANDRLPARRPG